ncbi:MAG: pyridoxamine kinase [Candidatus Riflebacteria bacterium]|nr:pyridoxamine kinase [Candidatus Riflebacteria bacterium]
MSYNKILTIQDISCIGQCSLTVALPILSACGQETCILPSAVLSTHTGGFKGFTFRDLTDDLPLIQKHWLNENIKFDAVYTGYLGSTKQIDMVKDIMNTLTKPNAKKIVDPAMADNGKLYVGFDNNYVKAMKSLCGLADYVLPNITEACFITDTEYKENYDEKFVDEILKKVSDVGAKKVILTGIGYKAEKTGVVIYENGKKEYYEHRKISKGCHGTGDIYASAFVGALFNGKSDFESAKIAADYTVKCIENTIEDSNHWYGAKFETAIPDLIKMLGK